MMEKWQTVVNFVVTCIRNLREGVVKLIRRLREGIVKLIRRLREFLVNKMYNHNNNVPDNENDISVMPDDPSSDITLVPNDIDGFVDDQEHTFTADVMWRITSSRGEIKVYALRDDSDKSGKTLHVLRGNKPDGRVLSGHKHVLLESDMANIEMIS